MTPKRSLRLKGSVYMTLIAVYPAASGFVVGADTQETRPSYDAQGNVYELRKAVQKIKPKTMGNYQVAIAGAGHAQLIDTFIVRAERAISADVVTSSAANLRSVIERQLDDFYRNDVQICQDSEKEFKLFVIFHCPATKEFGVWVQEQTVLRNVKTDGPELIGWEHELYSGAARKLYRDNLSIAQGVLAALYVMTVGEDTSNYIKAPFHVAVVRDNGIWMEPDDHVRALTERLRAFDERMGQLFLACADTGLSPQHFEETLARFGEESVRLHKQQLDDEVRRMLKAGLNTTNNPYPNIPPGAVIFLKTPPDASLRVQPDAQFEVDFLTKEHPVQFEVDARRIMADILRNRHGSAPEPLRDNSESQSSTQSDSQTKDGRQ